MNHSNKYLFRKAAKLCVKRPEAIQSYVKKAKVLYFQHHIYLWIILIWKQRFSEANPTVWGNADSENTGRNKLCGLRVFTIPSLGLAERTPNSQT